MMQQPNLSYLTQVTKRRLMTVQGLSLVDPVESDELLLSRLGEIVSLQPLPYLYDFNIALDLLQIAKFQNLLWIGSLTGSTARADLLSYIAELSSVGVQPALVDYAARTMGKYEKLISRDFTLDLDYALPHELFDGLVDFDAILEDDEDILALAELLDPRRPYNLTWNHGSGLADVVNWASSEIVSDSRTLLPQRLMKGVVKFVQISAELETFVNRTWLTRTEEDVTALAGEITMEHYGYWFRFLANDLQSILATYSDMVAQARGGVATPGTGTLGDPGAVYRLIGQAGGSSVAVGI